jgi:hypothetical protein
MSAINSTFLCRLLLSREPARHLGVTSLRVRQRRWPCFAAVASTIFIYTIAAVTPASAQSAIIDLSQQQIGAQPQNFEFWHAGRSDVDHWSVVHEVALGDMQAIQSSGADRDEQPSLAIYSPLAATNVRVRARFKVVKGSRPSVGLVIRVTSPDDYYLVRVGTFDQRLSLLHVVHGVPDEIAGVDADIAWNHWQTLEVAVKDDGFTMQLDDRWVLTAFDRGEHVSGRCGIWTEHSDIARFGEIEISPLRSVDDQPELQMRLGG